MLQMQKLRFRPVTQCAKDYSLQVAEWGLWTLAIRHLASPLNILPPHISCTARAVFLVETPKPYCHSRTIHGWITIRRTCNIWILPLQPKHLLPESKFVSMAQAPKGSCSLNRCWWNNELSDISLSLKITLAETFWLSKGSFFVRICKKCRCS